jgi:voltage-gated potassium channel
VFNRIKIEIYNILNVSEYCGSTGKKIDTFLLGLISLNVIAVILETIEGLASNYSIIFEIFEIISVAIFSIEYVLRIWSCNVGAKSNRPISKRIRFVFTPMALIDLLAILPFYLPMILPLDLRFLRALRLLRIFRILKVGRYSDALKILGSVVRRRKEELFITLITIIILLIIFSSLMFYIEGDAQPNAFSSIPAAMWWGIVTLSTVGYGDVYPVTTLGKLLGTIIAILGIGMFALPAGILGSGFVEEIQNRRDKIRKCPHCGKEL